MFTGLVEKLATVISTEETGFGSRLVISCDKWLEQINDGESICVSGCCLTVVGSAQEGENTQISFDVIPETLKCTTLGGLSTGNLVNLERSLRPDSLMGGHFVQGHVDGVENLLEVEMMDENECRIRISMNSIDNDTIVLKGSVTIDGVSLTIANVGDDWFEVALIPTTLSETTLGKVSCGDSVNIETDILARTVVQVIRKMQIS